MHTPGDIYIALDLETTGLDPHQDTIIEIAAIKFRLIRSSVTNEIQIEWIDERTLLIDPEREISEEVELITGISDRMVQGRKKWREVRDSIEAYLDDSPIVGHNVLFDISMLQTHGIDLSERLTIDTFELSEILVQEAESLNLGFLGKHLGLMIESEHRALDDTRLSVELLRSLLMRYEELDEDIVSELGSLNSHEVYHWLSHWRAQKNDKETQSHHSVCDTLEEKTEKKENPSEVSCGLREAPKTPKELAQLIAEKKKTLVITATTDIASDFSHGLEENHIVSALIPQKRNYLSLDALEALRKKDGKSRKEFIFLGKLLVWLSGTQTGYLEELKYYGEEREWKEYFRLDNQKTNPFWEKALEKLKGIDVLLSDPSVLDETHTERSFDQVFIFQPTGVAESYRKIQSHFISFQTLQKVLTFLESKDTSLRAKTGLDILQQILESVKSRPTGSELFPPGNYGETYFLEQNEIWHRGYQALHLALDCIGTTFEDIDVTPYDYLTRVQIYTGQEMMRILRSLLLRKDDTISIILQISREDTTLRIIPRYIQSSLRESLGRIGNKIIIFTPFSDEVIIRSYLQGEYGELILDPEREMHPTPLRRTSSSPTRRVELTTNLKFAKASYRSFIEKYPQALGVCQGISGGKGKMLSNYIRFDGQKGLFGLLDTWRFEAGIYRETTGLILARVPFDPPTDPFYLARTVGMRNNFENYSLPISLTKLLDTIHFARWINPEIEISLIDDRIDVNTWGKHFHRFFEKA